MPNTTKKENASDEKTEASKSRPKKRSEEQRIWPVIDGQAALAAERVLTVDDLTRIVSRLCQDEITLAQALGRRVAEVAANLKAGKAARAR